MLGHAALGAWSGGRYLHFGEQIDEDRLAALLRPDDRLRTVLTADVYGQGEGDRLVGRALDGLPREDFALVGAIGHDFYEGEREGPRGYPRFTDPRAARAGRVPRLRAHGRRTQPRALRRRLVRRAPAAQPRPARVREPGGLGGAERGARRRSGRRLGRGARTGQRLRARPHRLPGALRGADRLGDGDPGPARALARRAGARRAARRRTCRWSRGWWTTAGCSTTTCSPATSSAAPTTALSAPTAGSNAAARGSTGCARSPSATA